MALIIPNSLGYTYYNFRYYHFIILHCVILSVPIYYYVAYGYRIDYKTTIKIFRDSVVLGIVVYILNGFLGTNYWFIRTIPSNVSSAFTNWNIYIICFISLVFITMNTLYFISNSRELIKKWTSK